MIPALTILLVLAATAAVVFIVLWVQSTKAAALDRKQLEYDLRTAKEITQESQRQVSQIRAACDDAERQHRQARDEVVLQTEAMKRSAAAAREAQQRAAQAIAAATEDAAARSAAEAALARSAAVEQELRTSLEALRAGHATAAGSPAGLPAELLKLGVYEPTLRFPDAPAYVAAITANAERQRAMISDGTAAVCSKTWSIGGDLKAGERLAQSLIKLALRAFNGEADAAVSRVSWSNRDATAKRLEKAHATINNLLEKYFVSISQAYLDLRLEEIDLTQEQAEVEQRIREEQKEIREQMREEAKRLREIEQAKAEAEREERRATEALAKARAEIAKSHAMDTEGNRARIAELEARLVAAQSGKAQVISLAQFTKLGHVYIISNVGSLGDGVLKIGMTRRLDPLDRVDELGDASVPFTFDIHAMIRTQDAPSLEHALHQRFAHRRVNLINERKEYFQVPLREVQAACQELGEQVQFTLAAEAAQYRQSCALRQRDATGRPREGVVERAGTRCVASVQSKGWAVRSGPQGVPAGSWRNHLHDPLLDLVDQAIAEGWTLVSLTLMAEVAHVDADTPAMDDEGNG